MSRLWLAVLAYLLGVTLIITLLPFQFSRPPALRVLFTGGWLDITANVLLFLPLGFLYRIATVEARRHAAFRVLWAGALLSAAIEVAQLFESERYTSVVDVGANAIGAWLGAVLGEVASRRMTGAATGVVGRLSLELPLMGLVYLMVPLLWLHALASGTSDEHATLTLCLAVAGGSVIGGLQRHHFGPDRGVSLGAVVAVAAAWFFAGAFPLLATAPEMVLGGTGVVAGVAWWRGRYAGGVPPERERRYELTVLGQFLPGFAAYVVLLGAGPLLDGVGAWAIGWGFPGVAREWSRIEILRLLELVAAFTLGGYAVAEHRGRERRTFDAGLPRILGWAGSAALLVELLRGFHEAHGASVARGLLVLASGIYGAWLYYLQRSQVLRLLEEEGPRVSATGR